MHALERAELGFGGFNDAMHAADDVDMCSGERGYAADLPTWQLILEIRRLLAGARHTERLVWRIWPTECSSART
jgi:hypothetical protein